jgi:hypothetical protein
MLANSRCSAPTSICGPPAGRVCRLHSMALTAPIAPDEESQRLPLFLDYRSDAVTVLAVKGHAKCWSKIRSVVWCLIEGGHTAQTRSEVHHYYAGL